METTVAGESTVAVAERRLLVPDVAKCQLCSPHSAKTVTPSRRAIASRCLRISGQTTCRKAWCDDYLSGGIFAVRLL
jgi:hypothetical protein